MADTIGSIFGIKKPEADPTIGAANGAAASERARAIADQAEAEQRTALSLKARGRRGLTAFLSGGADTLG